MKICKKCKIEKKESEFYFQKGMKDGLKSNCKDCYYNDVKIYKKIYYQNNKIKIKDRDLKRNYNISLEDYNFLLKEQNNKCFVCKSQEVDKKSLAVDHCHKTGKIRSLLCRRCNTILGLVEENSNLLDLLKQYIESNK